MGRAVASMSAPVSLADLSKVRPEEILMERHRPSWPLRRLRLATAVAGAMLITSAAAPAVSASDMLYVDTSLTLTADRVGGIVIGADGIVLDCAGHTLFGDGSGPGIYMDGRTGVTIRNCVVTGFSRGIELHGSSHNLLAGNTATNSVVGSGFFIVDASNANTLQGNTAHDNGAPGDDVDGFRVQNSDANVLRDNVAVRHPTWGFIVAGGAGNRLLNNRSSDNDVFGFALDGATRTVLTRNTARTNGSAGFGVGVSPTSALRDNVATGNGGHGIVVFESPDTMLVANVATHNGFDGISISFSSGVTATGNRLEDNGEYGFNAFDAETVLASRNVVRGSLYNGFHIERVVGAQLTANTAESNGGDGFAFVDSTSPSVSGNVSRTNAGSGYALDRISGGRYVANTADRNGGEGFYVTSSTSTVISGNGVKGNGERGNGFVFFDSSELRIEANTASGAIGQCFGLYDGTHDSVLAKNSASDCDSAGFDVWNSTDNALTGNTATGNTGGPGFNLGPNAARNVLSANTALGNMSGFQLSGDASGGPNHNLLIGNVANGNFTDGFSVRFAASDNTITRNAAHANTDWDAIQGPDAGPGNTWVANKFGVTAGF